MTVGESPALERLTEAGYEVVTPSPGVQPTREQLLAALPGAIGWVAGVESIDAGILESDAATSLRVISRNGAGTDAIDAAAAERQGIAVLPARGANARGVAELALGLMIAGFRGLLPAASALKAGEWSRSTGRELAGATLGIVGYGAIGRILAELAVGCGMTVVAHDPFVTPGLHGQVAVVDLDEVLRSADVLSLHVPPQPDGPLLGPEQLALLTRGALVINTARSSLVDGAAMLAALESGAVSGYAVDAFDREPPEIDALLAHPRVSATPHLGAATTESIRRASEAAVDNLLAALA